MDICNKISVISENDTPNDIAQSAAIVLKKLSITFSNLKPDLLIILGDRFEILISAFVATLHKIPIAHIAGGEVTVGSYDNQFRHSISKMSFLHFVSNEIYKKRLIQMGENPKKVFNFGNLSLDNLKKEVFASRRFLEKKFKIKFSKINFLVTYHPETLSNKHSKLQFSEILKAISQFKKYNFIFTSANSDECGDIINDMIKKYVKKKNNAFYVKSFGQANYFSVLKNVCGVIGNSSSGIIEAPSFKIGTINIGDRQKGRLKSKSVIDCEPTEKSIKKAIEILYSRDFQNILPSVVNPYGEGNATEKIIEVLKNKNIPKELKKEFYDL